MRRLLILAAVGCMLTDCKHVEYITVPEYHTDTLRITHNTRDSIYMRDSIEVRVKGDTVTVDRWHTKYVEREKHDTIYQSRADSIPVPYPVTKYVEKQLTWWQRAKMEMGVALMGILGVLGIFGVWKLKKKLRL